MTSRKILIPFFCLFLSGMASLTYELLWIKQLTLVLGATLYAVSAVLCAFMTGLALGALCLSNWLAQKKEGRNLVRIYGLLEAGIGLYGLLFPLLLSFTAPVYPKLVSVAGGSDFLLYFLLFSWATLLMLPSTFLMGATLPVLGSWAVNRARDSIHHNVSLLYGLNTLGAVTGCLFTQWFAVKWWGVLGTTGFAVGLNLMVALLCLGWKTNETPNNKIRVEEPKADPLNETPSNNMGRALLLVFGFSGMVALSSEILWTRILVFPLGSSLHSFALILATFLLGIALGSLVSRRLLGTRNLVTKFLVLEAITGGMCFLILPAMEYLPWITQWIDTNFYDVSNTPANTLWMRSLIAMGFMLIPTLGFGLIFPLANQIQVTLFDSVPKTLGNSYAINTLGAILGTILTPFLLIPNLGIEGSLFILNAGLILLATTTLAAHLTGSPIKRGSALAVGLIFVAGMSILHPPGRFSSALAENNLVRAGMEHSQNKFKILDYHEGNFSTLSVIEETNSSNRTLYVDGFSTATVSGRFTGSSYMQAMGYIPMMLHPNPEKALVICFGTGNTLGTVARFPGVEAEGVEIDRNVLSLAHHFAKWNKGVLDQANVTVKVQDGRNHIRWTDSRYDVITLEPMHPAHAGVNSLYSKEFYEEAKSKLNPGGIMMQWLPLHLLNTQDSLSILKTFQSVFPDTTIWNSYLTRIVLLVGSTEALKLDPELFDAKLQDREVALLGEEIGVRSFADFLDFYIADARQMHGILKSAETITDNRPLLEHSSVTLLPPLPKETDETFLNLLRARLMRVPPVQSISSGNKRLLETAYKMRTAQRLSIFSQRYLGPGSNEFKEGNFLEALNQVIRFSKENSEPWFYVSDSGWQAGPIPESSQ